MTEETMTNRLIREVTDKWWIVLLKGIAAIVLGLLLLTNAKVTLTAVTIVLGLYLIISGILDIVHVFTAKAETGNKWLVLIGGIIEIIVGIIIFIEPIYATTFFVALSVYFVAFASLFVGFIAIIRGIQLRKHIDNEWTLIIGGALLIIYGGLLLLNPFISVVALAWAIGIASIVGGILMIIFSFRLRKLGENLE